MLVYGCGETEAEALIDHDINLRSLLQCATVTNLKFNKKKLRLRLSEIPYMGQILSKEGLRSDPTNVSATVNMKRPEDKKVVQIFF